MNTYKRFPVSLLYVEDEETTRDQIQQFLTARVDTVYSARNGVEGLELFRRHHPDLVVTDILMPVMDGLGMAKEIRAADRDIPIIVTTAYSEASYLLDAIEAGIDHYVMKPMELARLVAAIEKSAELIAARKAAARYREEREQLIAELQAALDKVKLLSGFLPICASCKKIRDDNGYWQQIEAYIRDHSEAEFSHGICPDCAKKLYAKDLKK